MTKSQLDTLTQEEFTEPFCDCAATTEGRFANIHTTGCASLARNWDVSALRRVTPVMILVLQEVDDVIHKQTHDDIVNSSRSDLLDDAELNVTIQMGLIRRLRAAASIGPELHTRFSNDVYEAPRDPSKMLRVRGIGRVAEEPRALILMLDERPTDDEMRALHDHLRLEAFK